MGASKKLFQEYRTLEQQQLLEYSKQHPIISQHYGQTISMDFINSDGNLIHLEYRVSDTTETEGDVRNEDEQSSDRFPCTDEQPEG